MNLASRFIRLVLSISTGVLLSLSWLGFPGWLLFVALVPLLILDRFFVENRAAYKSVAFWGHALLAFLVWNGLTTWWISYATLAGAFMAIVANAFLMSLVWWLAHTARRRFNPGLGYVALVVFWISFEFFHFHWDIEWPWLILGNGFAGNVKMIQWYEFTGTLGGTLWILIMNVLIFKLLLLLWERVPVKRLIYPGGALLLLLVLPVIYSFLRYHAYTEAEDPVNIVIVQPSIDPYSERYDRQAENEKLRKFSRLADGKTDETTDLVIGPETVFERYPDWNEARLHSNFLFRELSAWMQQYPRAEIIFGASTSRVYKDAAEATPTARHANDVFYDVFNSAVFIGRNREAQIYHKSILVPGVEKMPFRRYLGVLNDIVIDLGGTTGSLGRQAKPSNFELKDGLKVAPVICYESVFGEYLTKFVEKGAGLIVVITNDGWWRNTPGYKQHLSFARLRAIETRRSVARAANTGISAFINQRGDLQQVTGWWTETAIKQSLNANREITFYVKHGDFIARISLLIAGLLLLLLLVHRFIRS